MQNEKVTDHHHHLEEHEHANPAGSDRDLMMLKFMIDHHEQHSEELRALAERLENKDKKEAAELIMKTVEGFEEMNDILRKAADMLE